MVMNIVHNVKYIIKFNEPVDYFDIVMDEKLKSNIEFAGWIDEWINE